MTIKSQAEVLAELRARAAADGLAVVRGKYPVWVKYCECQDEDPETYDPQKFCKECDGFLWLKGHEPYCIDCGHSGCPCCPGWCDVLEGAADDMELCCDSECTYPAFRPREPGYWERPELVYASEEDIAFLRRVAEAYGSCASQLQTGIAYLKAGAPLDEHRWSLYRARVASLQRLLEQGLPPHRVAIAEPDFGPLCHWCDSREHLGLQCPDRPPGGVLQ